VHGYIYSAQAAPGGYPKSAYQVYFIRPDVSLGLAVRRNSGDPCRLHDEDVSHLRPEEIMLAWPVTITSPGTTVAFFRFVTALPLSVM
jgi:hypothetical protein